MCYTTVDAGGSGEPRHGELDPGAVHGGAGEDRRAQRRRGACLSAVLREQAALLRCSVGGPLPEPRRCCPHRAESAERECKGGGVFHTACGDSRGSWMVGRMLARRAALAAARSHGQTRAQAGLLIYGTRPLRWPGGRGPCGPDGCDEDKVADGDRRGGGALQRTPPLCRPFLSRSPHPGLRALRLPPPADPRVPPNSKLG